MLGANSTTDNFSFTKDQIKSIPKYNSTQKMTKIKFKMNELSTCRSKESKFLVPIKHINLKKKSERKDNNGTIISYSNKGKVKITFKDKLLVEGENFNYSLVEVINIKSYKELNKVKDYGDLTDRYVKETCLCTCKIL